MFNKQFVITQFSEDLSLATDVVETAIPSIGSSDILVKNDWIGINALYDRELYRGRVPYINVEFPYVFGVEAVGRVLEIGKAVGNIKIGEAVSTVKVGTAYQEYQICQEEQLVKIPAATPEYLTLNPTGVSAYLALEKVAELKGGETVVVSAAAGGLGHIVVQLCKRKNCKVVAICGTAEKVELLNSLGCCEQVINYRRESIEDILDKDYNSKIDVAFDSVGRHLFDVFLKNLAPLGRLIVNGLAAELSDDQFESVHRPRVYENIYWKGASVRCFMNHLYRRDHPRVRQELFTLYQNDQLQVKVDPTSFNGIESILDASQYLLAGKSCGKVVVRL